MRAQTKTYTLLLLGWLSVDPLADKYLGLSSYAYCANNPVMLVNPDGRRIVGATARDATKFKKDIHKVLANKKCKKIRILIDISGSEFKQIDNNVLSGYLTKISLSEDERTYINMVANTINSTSIHKVEYVDNISGSIASIEGSNAFKSHVDKTQGEGIGSQMLNMGNLTAELLETAYGGGFTVFTEGGSYSFICAGLSTGSKQRAILLGNEVFGHGIPAAKRMDDFDNNNNAIRTENLIRRLFDMESYTPTEHSKCPISEPTKLPITE